MLPIALALSLSAASPPLPLHHGGLAAPQAWVAARDGQLWVCWDGPLTDSPPRDRECWDRLPLELARDAALDPGGDLRVGFRDPDSLWIHAPRRGTWIVGRDGIATLQADAPEEAELAPLLPASCSEIGWLPTSIDGRWGWQHAPCIAAPECPRRPHTRRRPTGLRASLGVETVLRRRSTLAGEEGRAQLDGGAMLSLSFGLDRRRAYTDRQALRRWRRAADDRGRSLPAPRSRGPLGEHERAALRRGQCQAWGEVR